MDITSQNPYKQISPLRDMVINVSEIKQKIIKFLEEKGPSLPVHITKVTGMNLMFSSAILSEMLNEKTIKQSHLKIGSSSLYLVPGQENLLENFSTNLKGFEKEAFLKLKEKKILEDETQIPAIRVALQGIKDFAVPIFKENKKIWKYFITEEDLPEVRNINPPKENIVELKKENIDEEAYKEKINNIAQEIEPQQKKILKEREEILENISKKEEIIEENIKKPKKIRQKKLENQFFIEIKDKITSWGGNLIEAVYVSKKELLLKSVLNGNELLLVAFDKKRISENDLIKLLRKSKLTLPLFILTKGDMSKKMKDLLNIFKNVSGTGIL